MVGEVPPAAEPESDGWRPELPVPPRATAVANLGEALRARGLSPGAVRALTRASVRPDEIRRKLADPAELRVQGGTLLVVESRLWTMSVWPHPANPREYGHRIYPLGNGSPAVTPLVFEPTSTDGSAELNVRASDPDALERRIVEAKERLTKENPLYEDIAAEGILQPLTVVVANAAYANGEPPSWVLIAADGSSRISSAHRVLAGADLGKHPTSYELAADDRRFRRWISQPLRGARQGGWDELPPDAQEKLRLLTLPARIIVGYRSDQRERLPFHTAVRNLIGLTHIRPPKPYGQAVESEAKADAVLDALASRLATRPAMISELEKTWYSAEMAPQRVRAAGLPPEPDLRAAHIVRVVLGGGAATSRRVNTGIRALTAKLNPKREDRVDIAVELILRPLRVEDAAVQKNLRSWRAALQRAYRLPEISDLPPDRLLENGTGPSSTLEELRDQAIEEVESGYGHSGHLARAQTELAVKAIFYMATSDPPALQREVYGGTDEDDDRSPATVMRAMLSRVKGVHQAYAVVSTARDGKPLPRIGDDHRPIVEDGEVLRLTDSFVRRTYAGQAITTTSAGVAAARQRWGSVTNGVADLERSVKAMERVPTSEGGPSYVGRDGWNSDEVKRIRSRLDRIDRKLADWADIFDDGEEADPVDEVR